MKILHDFLTSHVKIRQDDIISKSRYRYIENFDISTGDTIRYIDIEPIFRYFRYIEAHYREDASSAGRPACIDDVAGGVRGLSTRRSRAPVRYSSPISDAGARGRNMIQSGIRQRS